MSIKKKQKTNPNYRPGIDPHSYRKDTHLKLGEPNPKDLGTDGYEYEEDILEDYKNMSRKFTKKELKQFVADGAKQGVIYNEKEILALKNLKFKDAFIDPEGNGGIIIKLPKEEYYKNDNRQKNK